MFTDEEQHLLVDLAKKYGDPAKSQMWPNRLDCDTKWTLVSGMTHRNFRTSTEFSRFESILLSFHKAAVDISWDIQNVHNSDWTAVAGTRGNENADKRPHRKRKLVKTP
jgi:hypothetical protein